MLVKLHATFHSIKFFKVQIEVINLAILCQLFETRSQLVLHPVLIFEVVFVLLTTLHLNYSLKSANDLLVAGLS